MAHSKKYRDYWEYENFRKEREKEYKARNPEQDEPAIESNGTMIGSNDLFKDAVSKAVLVPTGTVVDCTNHTFTFKDPKTGKTITCGTQGTITFGDGETRDYNLEEKI